MDEADDVGGARPTGRYPPSPQAPRAAHVRGTPRGRRWSGPPNAGPLSPASGLSSARRPSTPSTSSNSREAWLPSAAEMTGGASGWSSGRRRASSRRAGPSTASSSAGDMEWASVRSMSTSGANGRPSPPSSTHAPVTTRAPRPRARADASSTRRVFPTPASPPTSTIAGSPPAARSVAPKRMSSSSRRPTSTGLMSTAIGHQHAIP